MRVRNELLYKRIHMQKGVIILLVTILKVAKVNVSISTVHDAMPAPILTSARFTDALNGLTLTFDSTTNFGGQAGEFDCSLVLNTSYSMIKAKDTQLFGSSSAGCRFSSPTAIEMTFAMSPTIVSLSSAKNGY